MHGGDRHQIVYGSLSTQKMQLNGGDIRSEIAVQQLYSRGASLDAAYLHVLGMLVKSQVISSTFTLESDSMVFFFVA